MSMPPQIFKFETSEEQTAALTEDITQQIRDNIGRNGNATLLLPGGSSPISLMHALASQALPWEKITLSTSDERCVPIDSEQSNIRQLHEIFDGKGLPMWDDEQQKIAPAYTNLDFENAITLIGMGTDAHIASLFPNQPIGLHDTPVIHGSAPTEPKERVSMTLKALAHSGSLTLLINSSEKVTLLKEILDGDHVETPLAHLIRVAGPKLKIYSLRK
jgi:6-phosphogluconolactonase